MAESYFKDPLLAKWESLNPDDALWLGIDHNDDVPLLDALDELTVYRRDEPLRALILAELSGARRARERAEFARGCHAKTESDERFTRRQRERANAAKDALQYILEAFDGE